MKKLILRLAAGILASLILVAAVALLDSSSSGKRTDSIYYDVTGIHPDAKLLTVDNVSVSAETYFYWLDYTCDYIKSYVGDSISWDDAISEGVTYATYAENSVLSTVQLYATVENWANEAGVSLSEDDLVALQNERDSYVASCGGEEAFQQQLKVVGIGEEAFMKITETTYLYDKLYKAVSEEGGSLYPTEEQINTFASEQNYVTASILLWYDDGDEKNTAAANAANAVATLAAASNPDDAFASLSETAGYAYSSLTFTSDQVGETIFNAINSLDIGTYSDVIESDGAYFVAIRQPVDTSSLIESYFDNLLQTRIDQSVVTFNTSLKDKIDVSAFVNGLAEIRAQMNTTVSESDG